MYIEHYNTVKNMRKLFVDCYGNTSKYIKWKNNNTVSYKTMESGMIYANICTKGYIWDFTGIKILWIKK